jgi:hypothetical protein
MYSYIKYSPSYIKNINNNCTVCNNKLIEKIKTEEIKEFKECRACNLGIFNCSCETIYSSVNVLYYICLYCKTIEQHNKNINYIVDNEQTKRNYIANDYKIDFYNIEFKYKWCFGSIKDKLNCYGIKKLRILAKNKKLKNYSKKKIDILINVLLPITNHSDFPIK